jgi:hypothetical protein
LAHSTQTFERRDTEKCRSAVFFFQTTEKSGPFLKPFQEFLRLGRTSFTQWGCSDQGERLRGEFIEHLTTRSWVRRIGRLRGKLIFFLTVSSLHALNGSVRSFNPSGKSVYLSDSVLNSRQPSRPSVHAVGAAKASCRLQGTRLTMKETVGADIIPSHRAEYALHF